MLQTTRLHRSYPLHLSFARWFDSWAGIKTSSHEDPLRVDWLRVLPFLAMHLMCVAVIWVGWSWSAVAVAAALYALRTFALTAFYHRYFSHRAFKTSRWFQFVFACIGTTAVQRGPLWWAAHHRHHHAHSDRAQDAHSPRQHSFLWSHMGWFLSPTHFATQLSRVPDLAKFSELRVLDRFDFVVAVLFATGLYGLGAGLHAFFPGLGTNGMQMLVWGFFISTVILYHVTYSINSVSHSLGTRRYKTNDASRNNFLLALIAFGEGWHNNHHYFPASARQGFFWWEIDITYYLLVFLSWVGLVWDLKPVPERFRRRDWAPAAST